jgi:DNA-binding XRE family transcriptional regulator
MEDASDRLQRARQKAGYENAVDAARAFGWGQSTYISHENGTRGLKPTIAEKYARAFRVTPEYILYGERSKRSADKEPERRTVPMVGYVGAGATAYFFGDQGPFGEVPAPEGSSEQTVAVEIRGDSLGALFDRWIVFYDDVHRPVTTDQIGKLCVVGLLDGRILIKKIQRSRAKQGLFHLLSNTEAPILDVEIEWAAKVIIMVPQ